jgi:uncharacterized protein YjbI with pentapeptide repeats
MPQASICNCNIYNTDFTQADLSQSLFCQENNTYIIDKTNFLESNIQDASFQNLIMRECDLNHLDFSSVSLYHITITNSNIKYSKLINSNINQLNICNSVSTRGTTLPTGKTIEDFCSEGQ